MDERAETSNRKSCHSALRQAQRDNQSDCGDAPHVTLIYLENESIIILDLILDKQYW